ncbi:hypothetical protein GUITHDRAFT_151229 [Guillardia theta CCMP2712]|uniref:Zn(2)-C6 fungal-type domain-containing protein n=1 Tax=Guillardia theta (strain CCMP2712) TaxID=905079 RepID=L1JPC9_GUITC|nr:hypothetical protein GUITHDRAFT_151229 [Guillardia theta CCMP2712]EKX50139.1 hypothetical protein GUITHDRAFT_151229 [Guillardia theta CCMP2712]|eukprot:XP_005837119.1 hypothetical protein GUITHDRAFT_151229 [Guillardia theta CCMP2712]
MTNKDDKIEDVDDKFQTDKDSDASRSAELFGNQIPRTNDPGNLYKMRRWLSARRHPAKKACEACRKSKSKCQESRPCQRCMWKGLQCASPIENQGAATYKEKEQKSPTTIVQPDFEEILMKTNSESELQISGAILSERVFESKSDRYEEYSERYESSLMNEAMEHVLSDFKKKN